jgi:hypothetical protein
MRLPKARSRLHRGIPTSPPRVRPYRCHRAKLRKIVPGAAMVVTRTATRAASRDSPSPSTARRTRRLRLILGARDDVTNVFVVIGTSKPNSGDDEEGLPRAEAGLRRFPGRYVCVEGHW